MGIEAFKPNAPTLAELIHSSFFYDFMKKEKGEAVLLFWQEVEEYKRLPHIQESFIKSRALKIFNKFLKRGANLEVLLPGSIRTSILHDLDCVGNLHLFDAAQVEAQCQMEMDWYMGFLRSEFYQEMETSNAETIKEQKNRRERQSTLSRVDFKDILDIPAWQNLFLQFLMTEDLSHVLLFWIDVQNFLQLPKSSYLASQSKKLHQKYLLSGKVQVAESILEDIRDHLNYPSPAMFQAAQQYAFQFMESELFPQFKKTQFFTEYLDLKALEKQTKEIEDATTVVNSTKTAAALLNFETFLNTPDYRTYFIKYCEETQCSANIYFWIDCEDYKFIPSDDYVALTAKKIYRKYVKARSRIKVKLSSSIVQEIECNLTQQPSRQLFNKAQQHIQTQMATESFEPFKKSTLMKQAKRRYSMS